MQIIQYKEYTGRIPYNTLKTWNDVLMKGLPWEYVGWSGAPQEPYRHWAAYPSLEGEVARIWELVSDVIEEDGFNVKPERIITNLFSHGDSSWLHKDCDTSNAWTVIVYLNDAWQDNWYGGTVVHLEDGIRYCSPVPGKILIFESNLIHGPVPVSREALYPRLGLTFQTQVRNDSNLQRLSEPAISSFSVTKL